jgi:DNA invertase Pin-like site-specific DNA recombinase
LVDRKAVDVVIIAKLDRLTRSVADLAELLTRFKKRGVTLVSVADSLDTKTAAGRMVLNVMMSIAQWEREAVSERTKDALGLKRAKGERVGNVAYGSQLAADGVHLEANAAEQQILARIRSLRAAGATLREIAETLNREGVMTRRGTPWKHQYVAALLRDADSDTLPIAA